MKKTAAVWIMAFGIGSLIAAVVRIPPRAERMASKGTNGSVVFPSHGHFELGGTNIKGPTHIESTVTNLPVERIPVYVIPEALAVTTPQGVIVFVHEYHANELARKFPSRRLTNIVIYAK